MSFPVPRRLEGEALILRPMEAADAGPLAEAIADPLIWEQHPSKERGTPAGARTYADWLAAIGGTMIARRRGSGEVAGASRYYRTEDLPPGAWAIGFTVLVRDLWGGTANREMKALMLPPLFAVSDEVWFHIAPGNLRSQRATAKLGAVRREDAMVDHYAGKHLSQRWVLHRTDWAA
ncbi:MAG: GNAT family N-acetyltransferase [Hasllibacter sp.]